jgi:phenylpyruvate tautomerase PptA (4-oxalocrotonate tautomerase family)
MPMIQLTLPAGVLTAETRRELRHTLAATLLKCEGAPDTALFRSLAWSQIDEVPAEAFGALGDDAPRFRVDATTPAGALSDDRKQDLVREVTVAVLSAAGLPDTEAGRVWVLVHDQPEGTWGVGGGVIGLQDVRALAEQEGAGV